MGAKRFLPKIAAVLAIGIAATLASVPGGRAQETAPADRAQPAPGLASEGGEPVAPDTLVLTGPSGSTRGLGRNALAAMPQVEVDASFQTSHGASHGRYRGVSLWSLLGDRMLLGAGENRHPPLGHWFEVVGRDGYRIVFSGGEIDPAFGARAMLLAAAVDGKALPADDGIRLIVPGDSRGARSVRDVVAITVH